MWTADPTLGLSFLKNNKYTVTQKYFTVEEANAFVYFSRNIIFDGCKDVINRLIKKLDHLYDYEVTHGITVTAKYCRVKCLTPRCDYLLLYENNPKEAGEGKFRFSRTVLQHHNLVAHAAQKTGIGQELRKTDVVIEKVEEKDSTENVYHEKMVKEEKVKEESKI